MINSTILIIHSAKYVITVAKIAHPTIAHHAPHVILILLIKDQLLQFLENVIAMKDFTMMVVINFVLNVTSHARPVLALR